MKIEHYPRLPDEQDVYSSDDLSSEQKRVLFLASLTDAERRGEELTEDDVYEWLSNIGDSELAVCRDEDTNDIVGMISYDKKPDETWVPYLAVMPSARGGGVGRALIDHVKQQAGEASIAGRATSASETFYERLGMDVDSDRTFRG